MCGRYVSVQADADLLAEFDAVYAGNDEPVDTGQEVARGPRGERRLARPPHDDRQVVDEQRRDQRHQVLPGFAAGQCLFRHRRDLAANRGLDARTAPSLARSAMRERFIALLKRAQTRLRRAQGASTRSDEP